MIRITDSLAPRTSKFVKFQDCQRRGGWNTAAEVSDPANQKAAHAIAPKGADDDSKGLKEHFDGIALLMYFLRSSVIYINSWRIVPNRVHLRGLANTKFYSSIAAKGSPSGGEEMEKPKDNTHIERTSTQFRQRVIDIFIAY